jgi:hypothetical protein
MKLGKRSSGEAKRKRPAAGTAGHEPEKSEGTRKGHYEAVAESPGCAGGREGGTVAASYGPPRQGPAKAAGLESRSIWGNQEKSWEIRRNRRNQEESPSRRISRKDRAPDPDRRKGAAEPSRSSVPTPGGPASPSSRSGQYAETPLPGTGKGVSCCARFRAAPARRRSAGWAKNGEGSGLGPLSRNGKAPSPVKGRGPEVSRQGRKDGNGSQAGRDGRSGPSPDPLKAGRQGV